MVITIQLQKSVKNRLRTLKITSKETYEDVIRRLIREKEIQMRTDKQLLIEGCKVMAKESLKICKEWEAADAEVNEKYGD